jgi:hypothetical protein
MDIAPIIKDGWKFEVIDSKLSLTSEQNNDLHVQLSAKAAFSLLDYLYHARDELAAAAEEETTEEIEINKAERNTQSVQEEGMPDQHINTL